MTASVTFPLAVSTVTMQTPLPVILARFAWYGYSGNGALIAMAWVAGNDKAVGVEERAGSGCTAGAVRFFARVLFCAGMADVTGSSGGGVVCSVAGAGFRVDDRAAIFKLDSAFLFFGFGVSIASPASTCSGRFVEVASCVHAKGALASTIPVLRTAKVPRRTPTRKSPTRVRDVKLPPFLQLLA